MMIALTQFGLLLGFALTILAAASRALDARARGGDPVARRAAPRR